MKPHLLLLTIAIIVSSCKHSQLEQAMEIAGANRAEHKCTVPYKPNAISILGGYANTPHSYLYAHKIGKPPIKEKTICKTADIIDCRLFPSYFDNIKYNT